MDDVWQIETSVALSIGGSACSYLVTTRLPKIDLWVSSESDQVVTELDTVDRIRLLKEFASREIETEPVEARELVQAVGVCRSRSFC